MFVTVIPVGLLRDYAVTSCQYHLPCTEATIRELLQHLAIPSELVAIVLVNGRQRPKSHRLETGDVVKLVPLMGGG
jgi:sulfur carrier protein ThiS